MADPQWSGRWQVVAHSDGRLPPELPSAAVEVAGPEVLRDWSEPVLPKEPRIGPCRLCGTVTQLTREHAPTKATTNLGPSRRHEVEEWLARSSLDDEPPGGVPTQGGIWGYTLCVNCNNFTGQAYGDEYKQWVSRAWSAVRQLPAALGLGSDPDVLGEALARLDQQAGWTEFELTIRDVDPGRFVREVLAMMCSVAGPWELTKRHPEVRAIVLEGDAVPLPAPLALTTTLYVGPAIRVMGPTLALELASGGWEWACELAYPPFAHRLRLASLDTGQPPGMASGDLTTYPPGQRTTLKVTAQLGFGHTPFPGDFRTRAQVDELSPTTASDDDAQVSS